MRRTTLQFHATPGEISAWVGDFCSRHVVTVTGERLSPHSWATVSRTELSDVVSEQRADRLLLSLGPVTAMDPEKPDQCMITLGHLGPDTLAQSALSASWTSEESGRVWQSLRRLISGETRDGLLAVNPRTGDRVAVRGHRFSEGARRLADQGVALLPFAGTARLELPPAGRG